MISSVTHRERIVKYSQKKSVTAASMLFSVSRSTIYRWRAAYARHGRKGLRPRSTAPHNPWTVMTDLLRERILAHPSNTGLWLPEDQGPPATRRAHGLAHDSISVSEEDETGTSSETEEEALQGIYGQERDPMSYGWQMDFKGPYRRDGRTVWRLDMMDDASRLLLASVE